MSFVKCTFLLLCLSTTGVLLSSDVSEAFDNESIPSKLNVKAPEGYLQVAYGDSEVDLGNELNILKVAQEPTKVDFTGDSHSYYTLIMLDPDAPMPGQVLHWMKRNINSSDIGSSGDDLNTHYIPLGSQPGPPHRYIFLLYEHDQQLDIDLTATVNRADFSIDKFAEENQLGDPKFGNYFIGVVGLLSM